MNNYKWRTCLVAGKSKLFENQNTPPRICFLNFFCLEVLVDQTERKTEMEFLNRISIRSGNRLREFSLISQSLARDIGGSFCDFLSRRCRNFVPTISTIFVVWFFIILVFLIKCDV